MIVQLLDHLEDAIARQVLHGGDLPTNLLELGAVSEPMLTIILAETFSLEKAPAGRFPAPSEQVLVVARLLGGVSAGMAYPTTLALITALWSGPARTKSIVLCSRSP